MSQITSRRNLSIIIIVIIVSLLVGWYFFRPTSPKFKTLEGEITRLTDYKGNVVFLDFMATWCGPCQASMYDLISLHEEVGDDVVFISISVDPSHDTKEILELWKTEWGATWIHVRDQGDPPLSQSYKITGVPTYIILNKEGKIEYRHVGLTPKNTIKNEILNLVGS